MISLLLTNLQAAEAVYYRFRCNNYNQNLYTSYTERHSENFIYQNIKMKAFKLIAEQCFEIFSNSKVVTLMIDLNQIIQRNFQNNTIVLQSSKKNLKEIYKKKHLTQV